MSPFSREGYTLPNLKVGNWRFGDGFFDSGNFSPIFWYPKVRTFVESALFQVTKNGTLNARRRKDSENLAKHPPKWWGRHLFHAFFRANIELILKFANCWPFWAIFPW